MEYEKRIRCLENYRVRTISKDIVTINDKGEKIVDTSSPKYFYGQIPEFKIDKDKIKDIEFSLNTMSLSDEPTNSAAQSRQFSNPSDTFIAMRFSVEVLAFDSMRLAPRV